jgi:hypothetical protein
MSAGFKIEQLSYLAPVLRARRFAVEDKVLSPNVSAPIYNVAFPGTLSHLFVARPPY